MATAEADDDALGKRPEDDARNLNFKPRWNLTTTLARLLLEQRSLPGALSLGPMNAAFSGSWPRTTTARAKLAGATLTRQQTMDSEEVIGLILFGGVAGAIIFAFAKVAF